MIYKDNKVVDCDYSWNITEYYGDKTKNSISDNLPGIITLYSYHSILLLFSVFLLPGPPVCFSPAKR